MLVGVFVGKLKFLKIGFCVLCLIATQTQLVVAAPANPQDAKSQKQAQVPNKPVTAPSAPGAAATQVSSSAKNEANISGLDEGARDNSVQSDADKARKKTKKSDEDKSDEPIEFNDQKGILAGLDYPELQVVPRASERLAFEAQEEKSRLISPYWPVQMSAIALVIASITSRGKYKDDSPDAGKNASQKSENAFATQLGILTGGLWIGTSYYLSHYLSYGEALQEIKKINGKDKKSNLLRERLAEEALERPARLTYLVNTLSVWTTLFTSMYIASHTTQISPSYAGLAAAMAFMPWFMDNRITRNWEKHQEYKRKIYAPLTMGNLEYDQPSREWRPQLTLNWTF
jgi:hypothetical protein